MKSKKLRIYPTGLQKLEFKKWSDTSRYVYNNGVKEIQTEGNEAINFYNLRNKFVTAKDNPLIKEWELETPKDVRAGALRDLVKAYKTAFSNLKNGNIRKFNVSFRSKRNGFQSIEVPKTAIKIDENDNIDIYKSYGLDKIKKCKRDSLPEINFDCRLQLNQHRQWFLIIPYEQQKYEKPENKNKRPKCSLDPGIRKFQTLYSPNKVEKYTTNYDLLRRLKDKISFLYSQRSNKVIKSYIFKKKQLKLWLRHKNLIADFQHKLCNYLSNNYSEIYLPKFESQKLTKKLNRTSNFNILNLQHYAFKERLRLKCSELDSKLIDCTEEYTSKTCTRCGEMNDNLGSSETFKCSGCKLVIDRDVNGARNIYLKMECTNKKNKISN